MKTARIERRAVTDRAQVILQDQKKKDLMLVKDVMLLSPVEMFSRDMCNAAHEVCTLGSSVVRTPLYPVALLLRMMARLVLQLRAPLLDWM